MRKLIVLLLLPLLTACPGGGKNSDVKVIAELTPEIETTTTTLPAPTTTTQALALDYGQLDGKSMSMAYGAISFNAGRVVDTRCGYNYAVTSHSSVAGVVTVTIDLADAAEYTYPGNDDCVITVPSSWTGRNQYACPGSALTITANSKLVGFHVVYAIEYINGGYSVSREVRSKLYWAFCNTPSSEKSWTRVMDAEMYYE